MSSVWSRATRNPAPIARGYSAIEAPGPTVMLRSRKAAAGEEPQWPTAIVSWNP